MKPTEQMMEEHKQIKLMLEIINAICKKLEAQEKVDPEHIEQVVEFIMQYADGYHHAKEEDLFFPEIEKAGIPQEGGPVGVMLMEHDQGRDYVKGMREALARYKTDDTQASSDIVKNAMGYTALLDQHIDKEDHCLFSMADAQLTAEQQSHLLEKFAEVEAKYKAAGTQEKSRKLLEQLKGIYLS